MQRRQPLGKYILLAHVAHVASLLVKKRWQPLREGSGRAAVWVRKVVEFGSVRAAAGLRTADCEDEIQTNDCIMTRNRLDRVI